MKRMDDVSEHERAKMRRIKRIWRKVVERDKARRYETVEHRGRMAVCLER